MRHIKKSIITALALTAMLTTVGVESRSCMSVKAEGISYTATEARKDVRYKSFSDSTYYASVNTSSGDALITSLTSIISNGHTDRGYSAIWQCYYTSDIKPGTTDKIWDIYSNTNYTVGKDQAGNYSKEGDAYNREHSIPKSWFKEAKPMVSDAHHLYPTDGKVNGVRSNYPYGEVGTATYTSTNGCKFGDSKLSGYHGKVFEVADEYKGDLARTYFYMATRYRTQVGNWGGEGASVFKGTYPYLTDYAYELFTRWSANDPVSQKEITRNNAIYDFQGNRNPYIDHPEYIDIAFPSQYSDVEVDQTKVDAVIAQINALPAVASITLNDKATINAANTAYTALNYKEKQAVTNYSTLQAALNKIAELETPVSPTPGPNPQPVDGDGLTIEFSGVTTTSYEKDKSFSIGSYGFKANVCYAESGGNNGTFVRVGAKGNNVPDIPSKFGISGKGGSLEMTFDIANSSGVTFNVGGQMTGSAVEKWTILASTDGGSTWTKAANGTTISGSVSATLASEATSVRYALVIQGTVSSSKGPRLDLTSVTIAVTKETPQPVIDQEKIDAVIDLIDSLPLLDNLTLDDEEDVAAAVAAYGELTSAEKAEVTNADDLTAAVAKINELKGGSTPGPVVEEYALSVAEALVIVKGLKQGDSTSEIYKVTGTISGNIRDLNPQFGDSSFEMNDGTGENIYVYGAKDGESKAAFTASTFAAKIGEGKQVTVVGKLTKFVDKKGTVKLEITDGYVADKVVPTKPVEPTVSLSTVKTNKALSVSYDKYETISNVTAKTVVLSHISKLEYNLDSVEYGVIYAEKSKVNNEYSLIKESYSKDNTDYHYVKATITASDNEFVVKALLDLDINTEYVAVVVCIQNDNIVFANQATVKVVDMINYYLTNNLITDAEQASVLGSLIS